MDSKKEKDRNREKKNIERKQRELRKLGGKLNQAEEEKFKEYINNEHPKYSAIAYQIKFSQYKRRELLDILKEIEPLPEKK